MWLIFALVTTLIWGLAELFYKKGSHANEKFGHLKVCVCVGLVMGAHAIFTLLTQDIGYSFSNLLYYLPVSICYIVSMAFSFFGVRFIEESISDPIENTSGGIVCLMCAIFLKEKITLVAGLAVFLILVGIIGVGFLERRGGTNRAKVLGKKMAVVAFAMPFCYAILDALGTFLDIYYLDVATTPLHKVSEATIENVANTSYELSFAICALIILAFLKIKGVQFELPKQKDKILAAVCETAGQFFYVYAMSGNGAIAAPIISSVCVVSLLLSRIVLKEKLTARQYLYIGFVISGIIILGILDA